MWYVESRLRSEFSVGDPGRRLRSPGCNCVARRCDPAQRPSVPLSSVFHLTVASSLCPERYIVETTQLYINVAIHCCR